MGNSEFSFLLQNLYSVILNAWNIPLLILLEEEELHVSAQIWQIRTTSARYLIYFASIHSVVVVTKLEHHFG